MANDLNLTDMETCYKAVRGDLLKSLRLTSDRFGFEPEVTARLAQWGARIYEVPISYHGRTYAEGKNIGWRDGVEALMLILKFRFLDTRATDDDSMSTRQSIGRAPRFRRWLLGELSDYIGPDVLEVNSGPGHTTGHLLDRRRLIAADRDPVSLETLKRRFGHLSNIEIVEADFRTTPTGSFDVDTALLFDGLQRVERPTELLQNVASQVRPGGFVLMHVPAHADLFGPMDEAIGHVRRFSRGEIADLTLAAGLELVDIKPFNKAGFTMWRLYNNSGRVRVDPLSARLFDLGVPVLKTFDSMLPGFGLSWLVVARRS
jgi:SAM-dependent methyltransferase